MWVKCDIHNTRGRFHKWGYPKINWLWLYNGKFRGTPILGNPHLFDLSSFRASASLCQGPGVFLELAGCLPRCVRRTDGLVWRGRSWARPAVSDGHHRRYPTQGLQQVGTVPDWDCRGLLVASKTPSNTNGTLRLYYDMACKRLLTWLQIDLNWWVFYGDL